MSTWQGDCKHMQEFWKFNSHDGFLKADQGRAKNYCQIGWIGCPFLKPPWDINFLHIFAIPSGRHENIVKKWKDFLLYFATLETYSAQCNAFVMEGSQANQKKFYPHCVLLCLWHMIEVMSLKSDHISHLQIHLLNLLQWRWEMLLHTESTQSKLRPIFFHWKVNIMLFWS